MFRTAPGFIAPSRIERRCHMRGVALAPVFLARQLPCVSRQACALAGHGFKTTHAL
jgi:hypothetical protein